MTIVTAEDDLPYPLAVLRHVEESYYAKRMPDGTGALVPFSLSLAPPLGYVHVSRRLNAMGMDLVNNSPDEITEVVLEILQRLDGKFRADSGAHANATRFDEIAAAAGCAGRSVPGAGFLTRHADLLH